MGSKVRGGDTKKHLGLGVNEPLTSHDRMREQLARDVAEFLAHGGHITELEPHMRSGYADADQDGV